MILHFDPGDIQTIGVGIAALLSTVLTVFVFLSAKQERLGRPLFLLLLGASVWAWFGFFYELVPDLWLAREIRIVSVLGIVGMNMGEVHFALVYLSERVPLGKIARGVRALVFFSGGGLMAMLIADLFGTHIIVGGLFANSATALAPMAGPGMAFLIAYYMICVAYAGFLLAWRARAGVDEIDRRQATLLFVSMTVGLALGGTRFTPWYGLVFFPLVGDVGFPFFTFAALYAIQRYRLLNVRVAAAQILVFALWTFAFFRLLLDTSRTAILADSAFFAIVVVLGVFLLRSVVAEMREQRELAKLTIDRARSEFITIAAHQLRTPLSALRWTFDLLTNGKSPLDLQQRQIAQRGSQAADNMLALVNDLLNVARISDGSFAFDLREGDVRDVARTSAQALEESARKKNIRLVTEIPERPLVARMDAAKLALAVENLIDNAVKYTAEGGEVGVSVAQEGALILIAVRDSGIGIAQKDQAKLFEKFFRAPAAVRMFPNGSGLGLFIAKTIVEGQGGTIVLSSLEGRGTTVTVRLPVSSGQKT